MRHILRVLALVAFLASPGSPGECKAGPGTDGCRHPVMAAIAKAAQYDIYRTRVIVQQVYSSNLDLTVSFVPDESDATRPTAAPRWQLSVVFPHRGGTPRVSARNVRKVAAPKSKAGAPGVGAAVDAAARHLYRDVHGGQTLGPFIINAGADPQGYAVTFARLPQVPGGHTMVVLSADLRKIRVSPGR